MLTGAVIPRPIALVTTISPGGVVNAAPFSQFVIVAIDPGLLGISIGPRQEGPKDTLTNIHLSGEFVINMVAEDWAETVQACSEDYPPETSEVEFLGLKTLPSTIVAPPRLAGSRIQFECRLERILTFGTAPNHFIVGKVVLMHVCEGLVEDYKIDPVAYAPLARIGGRNFMRLGAIISVE
jgi:flavin reductase (DIM6/NTAB) family NADH-FMN oxidoreductase RutF